MAAPTGYSRLRILLRASAVFLALAIFQSWSAFRTHSNTIPHLIFASAERDFYKILGVTKKTDTAGIKKAYRSLSMKYHPDKNPDPQAENKFREIAAAYDVLSDPSKRETYDKYGEDGLKNLGSGDGGDHDPFDIFQQFGFGRRRPSGPEKTPNLDIRMRVTLEQLFFGELLHLSFVRPIQCINADECLMTKNDCQGPGLRVFTQQMGRGFIVQNQVQDDSCVDRKKAWNKNCKACPRGQTELEAVYLTAFVEQGMKTGDVIEYEGVGEQKLRMEPGNVNVIIQQVPHERIQRVEDDLHVNFNITLLDALVGFNKPLLHLNGKYVNIVKTEVTHDGEIVKLKGKGMPIRQNRFHGHGAPESDGEFGDMVVTIRVKYPVSLTDSEKEHVKMGLQGVRKWKMRTKLD